MTMIIEIVQSTIELRDDDPVGWEPGEFIMYLEKKDYEKIHELAKKMGWVLSCAEHGRLIVTELDGRYYCTGCIETLIAKLYLTKKELADTKKEMDDLHGDYMEVQDKLEWINDQKE